MERRRVLGAGAATGLAALAGCATAAKNADARTVFAVAQPMLPIAGSNDMFPVRRIYCIGRNYAAHSREMAPTRRASRRSSSRSRATRSSTSRPARPPTIPIRR